jgi:hypothetical protein
MSQPAKNSVFTLIVRFFSSYALATSVLALLLLVTFLGTLEQVDHGLHESQKKYFESLFITSIDLGCCLRAMHIPAEDWHLPVLMPGGYLLMILLSLNLIFGGVARIMKRLTAAREAGQKHSVLRYAGLVLAHGSIVFMLLAGLVSMYFKKDGAMQLREGQTSDEFQSFHDSVIEIEKVSPAPAAGAKRTAVVIEGKFFQDLSSGKARTFTNTQLPFDLQVKNYETNSVPKRADGSETGREVVDGYYLQPVKEAPEQEKNIDGAYVTATLKDGTTQAGIIWRYAMAPFSVKVGEEVWGVTLNRKTWTLPFAVTLDKFEREVHPGTEKARRFTSHVTVKSGGSEQKRVITMNEPLRDGGYALFQQSFDMGTNEDGSVRKSSTFQIVQNPSDHWPLISCIIVGIGLIVQMGSQLTRYLSRRAVTNG